MRPKRLGNDITTRDSSHSTLRVLPHSNANEFHIGYVPLHVSCNIYTSHDSVIIIIIINNTQQVAASVGNIWLFDLASDPFEERNVANDHPDIVANMQSRLAELAMKKNGYREPQNNIHRLPPCLGICPLPVLTGFFELITQIIQPHTDSIPIFSIHHSQQARLYPSITSPAAPAGRPEAC